MNKGRKLTIPSHRLLAFKKISALSQDDLKKLLEGLRKVPKGVNRKQFISFLSSNVQIDEIDIISDTIFSFAGLIFDSEHNVDEISAGLTNSYSAFEEVKDDPFITESVLESLKENLKYILLSVDSLMPFFQALEIINDSESVLTEMEIATRINLLSEDILSKSVLILHKLKISYSSRESEDNSQSITLDLEDLKNLKRQIDRAIEKEENFIANNKEFNQISVSE
ncbi:hypothetical protein A0256_13710 [Mucilaginibacter sp. PAMC 26640]|nr:hypothetical protein A0256_13710 [Mucilaginibacter sp. PAMC 26640]